MCNPLDIITTPIKMLIGGGNNDTSAADALARQLNNARQGTNPLNTVDQADAVSARLAERQRLQALAGYRSTFLSGPRGPGGPSAAAAGQVLRKEPAGTPASTPKPAGGAPAEVPPAPTIPQWEVPGQPPNPQPPEPEVPPEQRKWEVPGQPPNPQPPEPPVPPEQRQWEVPGALPFANPPVEIKKKKQQTMPEIPIWFSGVRGLMP